MEIPSFWHPISHSGEGKYEMLELNRRLESYLNHVKLLEEDNQLLWGEIQAMRRNQDSGGKRNAQEEALSMARKELQNAWRERDHVELEVSNLLEEIEELNMLRQKQKSAQADAKRKLEESRMVLEDEKRMKMWLTEQAAHLEKELSVQVQAHHEDLAALKSASAFSKPLLMAPQHSHTLNLQGLGEEYSQRAAQVWCEAAGMYQTQMKKLEENLDNTRAQMTMVKQEKQESQRQIQVLAKELESAKARTELIEKNMVQQRQRQNQDLQHLQAHVEALEAEKLDLSDQIDDLLVDSRNLLKMKMSLSLEVATYRALLDSESLRVKDQSAHKRNRTVSHLEGNIKSSGIPPGTQTISSCLFSSLQNTMSRSITSKANLKTPTPTRRLTLRTPQETLERPQTTKEEEVIIMVEKQKQETAIISKDYIKEADTHDHYRGEEEASGTASISSSECPKSVDEPESVHNINVEDDLQEVLKAELEPGLFSTYETAMIASPAGHPQTPDSVSSIQNIEETKSSEEGDEEETEVSTEMAQITHAPVSAWEENETVLPEDRDAVSGIEMESEYIAENSTKEFRIDDVRAELQVLGESTNKSASLLLPETSHLSADTFSPVEDDSEILTWADVQDDVIHFVEEESMKSAPEIEPVKGTEEVEEKMEETAVWPGIGSLEDPEFDINVEEEKVEKETEQEENVEQGKEDELTNGEEQMTEEEIGENVCEKTALLITNTYEKVGDQAEVVRSIYENDNLVGEQGNVVMDTFDKDQLAERNADEAHIQSDEEESLNISASWRTDPGEPDSYAQENTVADTRPLIHYKSDEETDANILISHKGLSEPTDSEEEREIHEGASHWSQIIAKRFDTMEDLSEEPELGSMDDVLTDGSVKTVLKESMEEEPVVENERVDIESQVKKVMDDALVDQLESDLGNNANENRQREVEETQFEYCHLSTLLVGKQEESSLIHDLSASLYNETREMHEQKTLLTTPDNISEDDMTEYRDKVEHWNTESIELNTEGENKDKQNFDLPLPEPFQEQALVEEHCEEASITITHADVLQFETDITKEQACPKEEDVQSNLSTFTHADLTDKVSIETNIENCHLSTLLVGKQEESSLTHDWSTDLYNETRETHVQKTLLTTPDNISEDAMTEYRDKVEHWNTESIELNTEGENKDKQHFDIPLLEPFQEQALVEEHCEEASIMVTHSDVLQSESDIAKEQACPKEEDVKSNSSTFTHADLTDKVSIETNIENYHLPAFLVEKQEESSLTHDLCSSLYNETRETHEQKTLLTTPDNISEDATTEYRDKVEHWNTESIELNTEGENKDKQHFDIPLLEPSQEQALVEEHCEEASITITQSDVLQSESDITEDQACPKEEDVQSTLPMFTHADFTDEVSLYPENQTNTNDSDLEQLNSSEDESPNASQCSQLFSQQLNIVSTTDVVSNADQISTVLLPGEEESSDDYNAPQTEELENKEEQQCAVDWISGEIDSLPQEWENLDPEITNAPHTILSTADEFGDVEMETKKDNMDSFQGEVLKEECPTNAKENGIHGFFTSSIKESIWRATEFEMAATYDPNDQTETKRCSYDSINPNQTFGEDWETNQAIKTAKNIPEKDMGTSVAQLLEEEGEEKEMPQAKQVQCRDIKNGDEDTVHAEDSTDEGDSWSSGEE